MCGISCSMFHRVIKKLGKQIMQHQSSDSINRMGPSQNCDQRFNLIRVTKTKVIPEKPMACISDNQIMTNPTFQYRS